MFVRQSEILQERRGPMRVALRERVWCTFQGKTMRCESEDISATGLKLSAPRYLPPGTRVELKPDHTSALVGRRRLCAQVVWARPEKTDDACLGLEFCEPAGFDGSWAASALQGAIRMNHPQARRTRRHPHNLEVTLLDANQAPLGRGSTIDLSLGGLCVTTAARPAPGDVLVAQLHLPRRSQPLTLACRTVSTQGDRLHLRFFKLSEAQQSDLARFLCGRPGWWNRLVRKIFA